MDLTIDSIMDISDISEFSGFDPNDFSGFAPPLTSTWNSAALQTQLNGLRFEGSLYVASAEIELSSNNSDMVFDENDSDGPIIELQGVGIAVVNVIQEELLDISPPFQVYEGIPGNRLILIQGGSREKGGANGGHVIVSESHGRVLTFNKGPHKCGTKSTYRCTSYLKFKCKAQCHVKDPKMIMRERGDVPGEGDYNVYYLEEGKDFWNADKLIHSENCPSIPGNREKILLLNECKRLAKSNAYDSKYAKVIMEEAKANVVTSDTITFSFPSNEKLCSLINRERKLVRARPPKKDGSDLLNFEFLTARLPAEVPEDFYKGDVTSEYKGQTYRHFVFFNETHTNFLRMSKLLIVDATFAVVQKPHEQLLVIHTHAQRTIEEGAVNLPIAYVLMQNKSESAYRAVFQKIKDIVEESGPMVVEEFLVDYERAIWNALRAVWVDVNVRGCWFHFTQCIYKKAKELKLAKAFLNHIQVHTMIRRLMTLALIDTNNIPIAFEAIKEHYALQINDPLCTGVQLLFEYFERQWIVGTGTGFGPKDYSCFEQLIRTTNIAESWNGEIYREGNSKRHSIYQLALLLARDTANCLADIHQYASKKYRRRQQVEKDKLIQTACRIYRHNGKLWAFLENLRKATDKKVRYTTNDDNTVD